MTIYTIISLVLAAIAVALMVGAETTMRRARRESRGLCMTDTRCFLYHGHSGLCMAPLEDYHPPQSDAEHMGPPPPLEETILPGIEDHR